MYGYIEPTPLHQIDSHLSHVKQLITTPALPVPQQIVVHTRFRGLRKTVALHYVCPLTSEEVVVESAEWSQWLKASYTLVLAGMCVVKGDVVGAIETGVAVWAGSGRYRRKPQNLQRIFSVRVLVFVHSLLVVVCWYVSNRTWDPCRRRGSVCEIVVYWARSERRHG